MQMPLLFRYAPLHRIAIRCVSMMVMRMSFIIVCSVVGYSVVGGGASAYAQNPKADSIKAVLTGSIHDTVRVLSLVELGFSMYTTAPDKTEEYARQAIVLAEKIGYKFGLADGYRVLGISLYGRAKYFEALESYQFSLKLFEELGHVQKIVRMRNNIGLLYSDQGNYAEALASYFKGLEVAEKKLDKPSMILLLGNIGIVYRNRKNYDEALKNYGRSLELCNEIGNKDGASSALNNIGTVYRYLKQYGKALEYYERTLKLKEELKTKRGVALTLNNIGATYLDSGDYKHALEYFERALPILKEVDDKNTIASLINDIGVANLKMGKLDAARQESSTSFMLAQSIGAKALVREAAANLWQVYRAQNNYQDALKYHEIYLTYKDSLFSEERERDIGRLENGLELARKKSENELLKKSGEAQEAEIARQRAVIIGAIIGMCLVAALSVVLYRNNQQRKKANAQLQEQNAQIMRQQEVLEEQAANIELANTELQEKNAVIEEEQAKSERLLLNILPPVIVGRLKAGEKRIAERLPGVTVIFADIVGFTMMSKVMSAEEVVSMLDQVFISFDTIAANNGLEKIKTIGDAYMAVAGAPAPMEYHAHAAAEAALEMVQSIQATADAMQHLPARLNVRIGMHTGDVVAGIIGTTKFSYDLWGDTVNTSSRMESHGQPGRVHCSQEVYELLKDDFAFEDRGAIEVKGKGMMHTYFLEGRKYA